jgi:mono/diheme cytochrome c family protein
MKTTAIVFFAACGLAFAGAPEGKAIYEAKCQKCHGPNGEGKDSIAKMLKVELKHLGAKDVQAKSDADLKKIITAGEGKMKPVADVTGKDLDNVVAYVRTLKP